MARAFVTSTLFFCLLFSSPQVLAGDGSDWVGAGVGTFTGFGLGHIFQGRYIFKGLMFTVIDGAGTYLIIEGLAGCVAGSLVAGIIDSREIPDRN